MFSNPLSLHYSDCLEDIERVSQGRGLSSVARGWLEDLERSLRSEIKRERRRESDDCVNRWRSVRDGPKVPERR